MNIADYRFGFRVLGDCRQPRRLVDAAVALAAYAECDERTELGRESYLSAFQFDDEFRAHLSATGSTAGFAGPCCSPWLWFDIDREDDLPGALDDVRRLCVFMVDMLDVRDDDLFTFYSGWKGFHVGIPSSLWQPEPGRNFHRIARRFAEAVAEHAGATIDTGIYDKVRCFRAPNSRHPRTGLHKRRLTAYELMHLGTERIIELARKPAPFELPAPEYRSDKAAGQWAEAADQVQREAESRAERLANGDTRARLNRATFDFIRDGAVKGDRHRLCYSAAANLAELGAPLGLCIALLEETALDCGLPPKDVQRAIENGWASVQPGKRDVRDAVAGKVITVQPTPAAPSAGDAKAGES